jgi:hypothetical protein
MVSQLGGVFAKTFNIVVGIVLHVLGGFTAQNMQHIFLFLAQVI